jgi:hypothetical protein
VVPRQLVNSNTQKEKPFGVNASRRDPPSVRHAAGFAARV